MTRGTVPTSTAKNQTVVHNFQKEHAHYCTRLDITHNRFNSYKRTALQTWYVLWNYSTFLRNHRPTGSELSTVRKDHSTKEMMGIIQDKAQGQVSFRNLSGRRLMEICMTFTISSTDSLERTALSTETAEWNQNASKQILTMRITTSVAVRSSHRIARIMVSVMLVSTVRQMMGVVRVALASTSKKREITVLQTFLARIGACAITRTRRTIKVFALRGFPLVHTKLSMMWTIQNCVEQTIPWTPLSVQLACLDLSWTVPLLDCLIANSTATTIH